MSQPIARYTVLIFAPGKSDDQESLELTHGVDDLDVRTQVREFVQGLLKNDEATKSAKVAVTNG